MDVAALPFNKLVGLTRPSNPEAGLLALDARADHHNHLGTVHASAQFALAEASSGEYLATRFADLAAGHVAILRRAETRFRRQADGALAGRARVDDDAADAFQAGLRAKGRASLTVDVEVVDASGIVTMTGSFEWFAQRLAEPGQHT